MREILFRGKRIDNGKLVYGSLIQRNILGAVFPIIRAEDIGYGNFKEWEVIPKTVGQYTGLKDKNGVNIFEWDFVRCDNYHGAVEGIVGYNRCYFYLVCLSGYSDEYLFNCSNFEVIGNIHDNPEVTE